jgi:hypothetical protein
MKYLLKSLSALIILFLLQACGDDEPQVENRAPVVKLTANPANLTLSLGESISLDATGSEDPENQSLTFRWEIISQPAGSSITLSAPTTATLTLQPTHAGQYKLKVSCSDGEKSATQEVTVTVNSPAVSFPQTISNDINADVVWENINPTIGQPDYIVSKSININAKLSIRPGVVVQVETDSELVVNPDGKIVAVGTNDLHVIFTSTGAVNPDWKGITISSPSSENEFNYVELHYAGSGLNTGLSNLSASLALDGGNLAKLIIRNTQLNRGGGYGIYVENNASITIGDHIEISNHAGTAVAMPINQIGNLTVNNNFSGNNGYDAVEVIGSEIANQTEVSWPGFEDNAIYYISGDLVIRSGLEIQPGVNIEFAADKYMKIEGAGAYVNAEGTAAKRITFSGKSKVKGFWRGISISSASEMNNFNHVEIANAGSGFLPNLTNTAASLGIDGDNLSKVGITNSVITEGKGYGIYLEVGAVLTQFALNEVKETEGIAMAIPANEVGKLDAASKFSTGNTTKAVEILKSTLQQGAEVLWKAFTDGTRYSVREDLEVRSGLRIEAGATFEFNADRSFIIHRDNNSYIIAKGTAAKKIVFTGKEKTKGYWNGIAIISNSELNEFDYVEVTGGGSSFLPGLSNTGANIGLDGDNEAKLKITNSSISNGGGWGLVSEAGAKINTDFKTANAFSANAAGAYKVP